MIKITEMPLAIYCLIIKVITNVLALILYIPFYIIDVLVKLGSNAINYLIIYLVKFYRVFTKKKDTKTEF